MCGRSDGATFLAFVFVAPQWVNIGEPQLQSGAITGAKGQRVVSGHFGAGLLRIYGGLIFVNEIFVESVFDEGRGAFCHQKCARNWFRSR